MGFLEGSDLPYYTASLPRAALQSEVCSIGRPQQLLATYFKLPLFDVTRASCLQDTTQRPVPGAGTQNACICREQGHRAVTHLIDILAEHVIPRVYGDQGDEACPFMVRSTPW